MENTKSNVEKILDPSLYGANGFDFFLDHNEYFRKVYFHLSPFVNLFSDLKAFVVKAKESVDLVKIHLKEKIESDIVINSIPQLISTTATPFEGLIAKWVIADFIHLCESEPGYKAIWKENGEIKYQSLDRDGFDDIFYETIKIASIREAKDFGFKIEINTTNNGLGILPFDSDFIFGRWRLINLSEPNLADIKQMPYDEIKNNFDKKPIKEVYDFFKKGLVDKGYLIEDDLLQYLMAAFENKKPPETLFRLNCGNEKQTIKNIFYKYYLDIAMKPHGEAPNYAALLGNYFEGFNTENVRTNWRKGY